MIHAWWLNVFDLKSRSVEEVLGWTNVIRKKGLMDRKQKDEEVRDKLNINRQWLFKGFFPLPNNHSLNQFKKKSFLPKQICRNELMCKKMCNKKGCWSEVKHGWWWWWLGNCETWPRRIGFHERFLEKKLGEFKSVCGKMKNLCCHFCTFAWKNRVTCKIPTLQFKIVGRCKSKQATIR